MGSARTIGLVALIITVMMSDTGLRTAEAQQGAVERPAIDQLVELLRFYESVEFPGETMSEGSRKMQNKIEPLLDKMVSSELQKIDDRRSVVVWTNFSANSTFVFAHMLLVIGVYAAYREYRHASKLRKGSEAQVLEIKLGLEGIAFKSSMLGFAALLVSLVFYFAYLKFVYPVLTL